MQIPNSRPTATARRLAAALRLFVAAAAAALFTACVGGSGSSGFDLAAENAAIDRALDTGTCQMDQGLTICASGSTTAPTSPPASPTPMLTVGPIDSATPTTTRLSATGTPTPTGTPPALPTGSATPTSTRPPATPTPTPTATPIPAQPGLETNIASSDVVFCEPTGAGQPCVFSFSFVPSGLPDTTAYRVAVRSRDPDSDWTVLPVVDHSALVTVDPDGPAIQIAVLAFLDDPGFVPDRIQLLGDSGADYAFVTPPLIPEGLTP